MVRRGEGGGVAGSGPLWSPAVPLPHIRILFNPSRRKLERIEHRLKVLLHRLVVILGRSIVENIVVDLFMLNGNGGDMKRNPIAGTQESRILLIPLSPSNRSLRSSWLNSLEVADSLSILKLGEVILIDVVCTGNAG